MPRHTQCHFLRDEGCSIHPAKPTQCRIFPFWPELVDSKREWRKTAAWCPGIGKGALIQIETARGQAQEMREAYPGMYGNAISALKPGPVNDAVFTTPLRWNCTQIL